MFYRLVNIHDQSLMVSSNCELINDLNILYLLYYGNAEYIGTYYDKMLNEETLFLTCHGQAFLLDSMPLIMRPCLEVVVNNANLGCLWLAKPSLRPQNGCIIFIGIDWPISLAVKTNPPWEILLKGWEFMVAL